MAINSIEEIEVRGDNIMPDLLVWRRYRRPYTDGLAKFLDINPELSDHLGTSPFLKVGSWVRMPIDDDVMRGVPNSVPVVRLV